MSEAVRLSSVIAPAFHELHRSVRAHEVTHHWLRGGRGSTKSTFISIEILMLLMRNPFANAIVMRKVGKTLRNTVYAQLLWSIGALGLDSKFRATVSPMEITYKPTGQKIVFIGLDEPEKIKSIKFVAGYPALVWFEEVDQFSGMEEIRNVHQSLLRGGDVFWCFYSFNPPRSRDNWVNHEVTVERTGRIVHSSDYRDVPEAWLGEQFYAEIEELLRTEGKTERQVLVDDRAYRHEYLGEVTGSGGNVFENVVLREVTDAEIASFDRVYNGVDWGWYPDPWTFGRCAYLPAQRSVVIFDEASGTRLSNEQSAAIVKRHLSDKDGNVRREPVVCDSAERKSTENYRALGIDARNAVKGPGSREHGFKWLASRAEIVIDPKRCPLAAREFVSYEFEQNREGTYVSGYPDGDDHSIDRTRYALESVMTRRRNV